MSAGHRKQRYVLDIDDIVRRGFMTKANAEALLAGATESGTDVPLGVVAGGSGSKLFDDKELIYYDAVAKRFKSSGYAFDILGQITATPGNPWNTGVVVSSDGVDNVTILDPVNDIPVLQQSVTRPADSKWVYYRVVFSFFVDDSESPEAVTEIKLRFGDDAVDPVGVCKTFSGPFTVKTVDDSYLVTWQVEGIMPDDRSLDDPFLITVFMVGAGDDPSKRSGYVYLETRGPNTNQVPSQIRGIPVFLPTPIQVFTATGTNAGQPSWTSFDISGLVPPGSSAVILQSNGQCGSPDGHNTCYVQIRKDISAPVLFLTGYRAAAGDDSTGTAGQGIFAFRENAGVRTFDYKIADNVNHGIDGSVTLTVVGYIT